MSSVGSGSSTVELLIAFSAQSLEQRFHVKGHQFVVVRYLYCLNGANEVLSRLQFELCLDSSANGFNTLVKYLDSWQVGDPQKETMGRIGMLGLCSFGSPYSLGGCGTLHLSLLQRPKSILSVFFSVSSLLLSLRCSAGGGSRLRTSQVCLSLISESILSLQSVLSITTVTHPLSACCMTATVKQSSIVSQIDCLTVTIDGSKRTNY